MVAPHHAHILTQVEPLGLERHAHAGLPARREAGDHRGKVADGHVDFLQLEHAPRVARGQRQHAQRNCGRFFFCDLHQAWNELGRRGVGHGQQEGGVGGAGIEFARRQRVLQLAQGVTHGRPQGQRAGRGLHTGAGAAHQLVSQHFPQAAQCVAHRGLRDRQVAGGAREVALRHHLVEDAEQVEIERAKVDVHQCCE
jgi:hypothetical protein